MLIQEMIDLLKYVCGGWQDIESMYDAEQIRFKLVCIVHSSIDDSYPIHLIRLMNVCNDVGLEYNGAIDKK